MAHDEHSDGPSHIKLIDGKYRIMDKKGKNILHAGDKAENKPADGGGFSTHGEAMKQLMAIQFSKHGG